MAFIARNGLWLTRETVPAEGFSDPFTSSFFPGSPLVDTRSPLPPDGIVQAVASGMMRLAASSNIQLYSSSSNVLIGAQGTSNVLDIGPTSVTVHGDLRVRGALDAIMTSELFVRDKVLRVAVPVDSNTLLADAELDGAGIVLARGTYDKALTWNAGAARGASNAAPSMLTSNAPFWELQGGALRLSMPARADSVKNSNGGRVGYGFRITPQEELEIFKFWTDAADGPERQMRVFGAGPPLSALDSVAAMAFPRSTNPYAGG